MRTPYICAIVIIVLIALAALVAVLAVYSGVYNVSALYPDRRPVAAFFDTTMARSVRRHAAGIKVPPLSAPAMIREGFSHYREMCVECHGAPGVSPGDIAQGLRPPPPPLYAVVPDWAPAELFWITKNGIRMTGMPAWAPTHTDREIWSMVAFMETLPSLTPAQYKALLRQVPPAMD